MADQTTDQSQMQMPSGIDPQLAAIYQKSGVNPADRGSGFADWQYWQDKGPSQYARLTQDLAGTGNDQPTGTPGQGVWQQSGRNAPPGWGGMPPTGQNSSPGGNQGPSGGMPGAGSVPGDVLSRLQQGYNTPAATIPSPTPGAGPSMTTPNSFWNAPSPAAFGAAGQAVPQSPPTQQSSALLQQLLARIQQNPGGGAAPNGGTANPIASGAGPVNYTM